MKLEKCLFSPHMFQIRRWDRRNFLTCIQCNSIDYSQHGFNLFIFWLVILNHLERNRSNSYVYAASNIKWTHSLLDDERNKKKRCNRSLFNFSNSSIMIKQQEEIIVKNWDQGKRCNKIKRFISIDLDVHDQQVDNWEIQKSLTMKCWIEEQQQHLNIWHDGDNAWKFRSSLFEENILERTQFRLRNELRNSINKKLHFLKSVYDTT